MRAPSIVAIWVLSLVASFALALTARSSPADPSTPLSRSIAPATRFTEDEAKSRFEARGYSNVRELHKDAYGIWRGTATRNGKTFKLSLDVEGNVGIE
jgi:hypothetical protein